MNEGRETLDGVSFISMYSNELISFSSISLKGRREEAYIKADYCGVT